jgi:hypothetical protein
MRKHPRARPVQAHAYSVNNRQVAVVTLLREGYIVHDTLQDVRLVGSGWLHTSTLYAIMLLQSTGKWVKQLYPMIPLRNIDYSECLLLPVYSICRWPCCGSVINRVPVHIANVLYRTTTPRRGCSVEHIGYVYWHSIYHSCSKSILRTDPLGSVLYSRLSGIL